MSLVFVRRRARRARRLDVVVARNPHGRDTEDLTEHLRFELPMVVICAAGHPLAIVSSKLDEGIRRSMDYFRLTPLFDAIVGIDHTTRHKPHPEPVEFALARLGVAPADALFIGDSPHDVEAGNAAGVRCVAVTWGAFTREAIAPAQPAHWLDRVAELPALVARGG